MKKRKKVTKVLSAFLIILLFITIFLVYYANAFSNNVNKINNNNNVENVVVEEKKEEYIDDNNITIGLYLPDNNYHRNLIANHVCNWNQYTDIVVFDSIPSNEQQLSNERYQTLWPKYWTDDSYKIGYYLSFKTKDKTFEQTILGPDDGKWFFDYIQIYLYDDVHQDINARYSHVENVTENTILTSIKLTASTYIDEIESPIKLTVFTYNGTEDFDPVTGMYRGNSKYSVDITKAL